MEKDCFNCKHYNKLRYMRRGCFVDSEFSFCSKTCRIKKELALCADFQPAGKRYPAAECVAELADNIKAAVGRLNNMMNNLFVDARPDDLLRKKKSFEELLAERAALPGSISDDAAAEHEDRAGDNSVSLESKSNSRLGELESSSGGNPAELESKAGDNSAYLDSKSDSRSGDLKSSPSGNPAELESKGDKSDADD